MTICPNFINNIVPISNTIGSMDSTRQIFDPIDNTLVQQLKNVNCNLNCEYCKTLF